MRTRFGGAAALLAALVAGSAAFAAPEPPKAGAKPMAVSPAEATAGPVTPSTQAASVAAAARAGTAAVEAAPGCARIKVVYAGYGEAERAGCPAGTVAAAR